MINILEFTSELPKVFFILAQLIFEKSRISHIPKSSEETNHQVFELHEFPLLHFQESVNEKKSNVDVNSLFLLSYLSVST